MSTKPPKLAFDLDHDLRALSAMASNLTPYLYENEMYGPLVGDLPRLTIGGLLLRLYRLSRLASALTAGQQTLVKEAQAHFVAGRDQWAVHYDQKLHHELKSRLDAFSSFLDDCTEDLRGSSANYPSQAEKRTMIEHLRQEAEERQVLTDVQRARLKEVDQRLAHLLKAEEFIISDDRLASVYPRGEFWWLYGYIPENNA